MIDHMHNMAKSVQGAITGTVKDMGIHITVPRVTGTVRDMGIHITVPTGNRYCQGYGNTYHSTYG